MSIIEQARILSQQIASNANDFGEAVTFISPSSISVETYCLQGKHHTGFDIETGTRINTQMASICVSEDRLNEQNYPTRNDKNEVSLKNHKVELKDSTGVLQKYTIRETYPDETLGLIVCILGDYID